MVQLLRPIITSLLFLHLRKIDKSDSFKCTLAYCKQNILKCTCFFKYHVSEQYLLLFNRCFIQDSVQKVALSKIIIYLFMLQMVQPYGESQQLLAVSADVDDLCLLNVQQCKQYCYGHVFPKDTLTVLFLFLIIFFLFVY